MQEIDVKKLKREFKSRFSLPFRNGNLLVKALKHRSYLIVTKEEKIESNERLEFLGDSILNFVLTELLYDKYPNRTEGELSKMKSILVSKKVLADIAERMELGHFILLNHGEEKTGGRQRPSVLADAVEAIIGAIYLDRGIKHSKRFIQTYLINHLDNYIEDENLRNYKSELLELIQAHSNRLPVYEIDEESGPEHEKVFHMDVYLGDMKIGSGEGRSKKSAEQDAASKAIEYLNNHQDILK